MWRKGFFSTLLFLMLSACDSGEQVATPAVAQVPVVNTANTQQVTDLGLLAEQYKDQALQILDASELEEEGASVLSLTFSVPLQAEQNFAQKVHAVDSKSGKLDGAWELSDDLLELRLRHIPPKRKLII
ncbi:MAG TPA: hypothetical protein GX719_05705, partial [Gammaproteobacteria bacterium]|nr:hypothetical protein [Gammaproteobacteria bacterium]